MLNMNKHAAEIHAENAKWWVDLHTGERIVRNKFEMLMLVISEFAEAMEGERKDLMDDKLPHRKMAEVEIADALIRIYDFAGGWGYDLEAGRDQNALDGARHAPVPDNRAESLFSMCHTVTVMREVLLLDGGCAQTDMECLLAFVVAQMYVYAEKFGYDIDAAMVEKRAFNRVREDHKAEARKAAGGKKF